MKITFACSNCGKSHTVDESLAGKKGRCKDCGGAIKVPESRKTSAPPGPSSVDLYGLDEEVATVPRTPAMSRNAADVEEAVLPRRAQAGAGRTKRKKTHQGEPWNLPLRSLAVRITGVWIGGFLLGLSLLMVRSSEKIQGIGLLLLMPVGLVGMAASVLTWISVLGAGVSLIRGNGRAFSGESIGGQILWIGAIFWTMGSGMMLILALPTAILSAQNASARAAAQNRIAAPGMFAPAPSGLLNPESVPNPPSMVVVESLTPSAAPDEPPLSEYRELFEARINANNRFAELFETLLAPGAAVPPGAFDPILALETQSRDAGAKLVAMPRPSPLRAKELRQAVHAPLKASLDRVAQTMRVANDVLRGRPVSAPVISALGAIFDWEASTGMMAGPLDALQNDQAWFDHAVRMSRIESIFQENESARMERIRSLENAFRPVNRRR